MSNIIETKGPREWLQAIKDNYDINSTTLNSSERGLTVIQMVYKINVMVAGYCRETGVGIVFKPKGVTQ